MSTVFYSVNCLKRKAIHGCQYMDTFRSCLSSDSNWIPPSHNKKSRSRSALGSADSSTTSILRPGIRILSTTSMLFLIIWLTHFCLSSNYESIKKLKEAFQPRLAQFKNVESFHWRLHLWEGEKFGDLVTSFPHPKWKIKVALLVFSLTQLPTVWPDQTFPLMAHNTRIRVYKLCDCILFRVLSHVIL